MTKIQRFLAELPEDKKVLFQPVFGDVDRFYEVVYLIAKNEHYTDLEKPDRYEDRLERGIYRYPPEDLSRDGEVMDEGTERAYYHQGDTWLYHADCYRFLFRSVYL